MRLALQSAHFIGANTAVFSLVDVVLFRLLPIANPNEVVRGGAAAQRSSLFEEGADARLVRHRKPIAGLRACVYVHLRAPHIGRGSTRNLILLQEEDPLLIFRELGKVNPRYILASRKSEDHLVLFGFCTFEDGADFENGFMPVRLVLGDV